MRKILGLLPVLLAVGGEAQTVPLFPHASDVRQGFVRVINPHGLSGDVTVTAYTDTGARRETSFSFSEGEEVRHFNSDDLEYGNSMKGITGIGQGTGDWRLEFTSDLTLVVPVYMRTKTDGFLTSLHDTVPKEEEAHRVHIFNPGSNDRQRSVLRLVNPNDTQVTARVTGTDDAGRRGRAPATVTIPPNGATALTAVQLEDGGLGDGTGKWRLSVTADRDIIVMNLMETPSGHLTNLSTAPAVEETLVPLFPGVSHTRQGFVRIINETDEDQTVTVTAYDHRGTAYGPIVFTMEGNTATHFNADDLENGNTEKGITGVGRTSYGDWHLTVEGQVRTLSFMRMRTDGFLTSLHDIVPENGQIATFNPASNDRQRSVLRLIAPNAEDDWSHNTFARDDAGFAGRQETIVYSSSPAFIHEAQHMENFFGDGTGKWRLRVVSDRSFIAMNLMETPSGHLTNLSTIPSSVSVSPDSGLAFAGQGALIERITEAGGHRKKVVVWESWNEHAENMRDIMLS